MASRCYYFCMTKKYPSDSLDKFMVRFPEGMKGKIKEAADKSGRSMNAEIVSRLEKSFIQPKIEDGPVMNVSPEQLSIAIALAKQITFSPEDLEDLMSLMKRLEAFTKRFEKAQAGFDIELIEDKEKKEDANSNPKVRKLFLDKDK